ncbi:MAG: asparagine synthase (glutamine-hydrolyzing) [Candidatus Zambryskibacteria bacterium RIFCSPHIGHO2_01_FULL_46_30]|uniref:asparagine synthase (glutamine-hydrolyzing) n=1 Tax=Candidatus Zambryskibacteria bacterium RIFCSPHIGHO2_01_FULL_46_30 TaxID=1802739 RepID=A0A1G2T007_9BACT|nr:MAG: asparagine synthase (glutamine-hydrolyzing) [Candidatus Zambryskibacteria bacterium RIFCSPHIGHO2_01_FULL_46_30]OHB05592.1 MAG: asparagine synthase (glutamine-hydrolyzing) [Candidatus Zambryskibacteria bacterium RIFCSPLOWO2_01_FULL_47_33]
MCGISGFIDKRDKLIQTERELIIRNMLRLMRHRGGDAMGIKAYNNMTIGHTRLSIVDSNPRANQPLVDVDSILSFNGEIYNHRKLRNKYGKRKLISYSDTATLLELLRLLPLKRVLTLVQGMYAFSYFNKKKDLLILALDKFSIKPLYYIDTPDYFAWASEIKAFKALPQFTFQFNNNCLEEYLVFRYIAGEKTLFKNIYKMRAGEYLVYSLKNGLFKKHQYYNLKKIKQNKNIFPENILKESIRAHLMSDTPVGVQLSGGLDSSLVAFFAKQFSKNRLHTFSIGLKDKQWNEFKYSDSVAKLLKTIHHKIFFSKHDFARLFPKLTYYLDEPLVHSNTIPMYILAKKARKYTKVLLTGEGADEIFYGYNRYFEVKLSSNRDILLSSSFSSQRAVSRIIKSRNLVFNERNKILETSHRIKEVDRRVSYYDIYTYLPHVLLRQDKAGMSANIENRVPFLYEPVVERGFSSKTRTGKFGGKTALKKVAIKYFPEELVLKRKCGFGLPITDWLKDKDALLPHLSVLKKHHLINTYFVNGEVKKLIREHIDGKKDHSAILFSIISLVVWYDVFIKSY